MTTPYVKAAAVVTGWPAWVLGRLLDPDEVATKLPAEHTAAVLATLDAIRRAGDDWHASISASGSAEVVGPEVVQPSDIADDATTQEAADALMVTPRRVRQLIDTGDLPARRVGGRWQIDRTTLTALAADRQDIA